MDVTDDAVLIGNCCPTKMLLPLTGKWCLNCIQQRKNCFRSNSTEPLFHPHSPLPVHNFTKIQFALAKSGLICFSYPVTSPNEPLMNTTLTIFLFPLPTISVISYFQYSSFEFLSLTAADIAMNFFSLDVIEYFSIRSW